MDRKSPIRFESTFFKVSADEVYSLKKRYCDTCPICKGERVIEESGPNGTRMCKCKCLHEFNKAYMFAHANIPIAFRELTSQDIAEEFKQKNVEHYKRAVLYNNQLQKALKEGFGLFVQGENGSGKSFIATIILKNALKAGYTGYFILMSDLIKITFEAMHNVDVRDDLEKVITQVDFLIIDEIDKGFQDQNDVVQKMLLPLFKKRCDYFKKPLIVTSNVVKAEIDQTVGKTIAAMFTERLTEITFVGNYRPNILGKLEQEFFND